MKQGGECAENNINVLTIALLILDSNILLTINESICTKLTLIVRDLSLLV